MIKQTQIRLLASAADREALQPLLDALTAKGLRIIPLDEAPKKDDTVLAVLSEGFYADAEARQRLLALIGAGAERVLPLQLDSAEIPDALKNAIYARNIIPAFGRDTALLAERIVAALPKKKNRLPLVLSAAALVLLAAAGLLLWQKQQANAPAETSVPAMAEASEAPSLPIPEGITPEELAQIRCVAIIGEHFSYYASKNELGRSENDFWPDMLHELASEDWDWESREAHWYWHEDGSEVSMTGYDLRFLSLMPNLEELHLAAVTVEQAPDLSALEHFKVFWGYDSELGDLSWLAASKVGKVQIRADVDYSPLGSSTSVTTAILDVLSERGEDFSAFSPKRLQELHLICNGGGLVPDLSGLAACTQLHRVDLQAADIRDLSFLEGKTLLSRLTLVHLPELRDLSALSGLTNLKELEIHNCNAIADYSPISACSALERFRYRTENDNGLRDASFLAGLAKLTDIELENVDLNDLGFLRSVNADGKPFRFGYAGSVNDFSGLEAIKLYEYLSLDPSNYDPFERMLPYLQDATIRQLALRRFVGLDLSALPYVSSMLTLDRCDLADLTTLPEDFKAHTLELVSLPTLRSLDGLQNQTAIGQSSGELFIRDCPRLTDWSALEGMKLYNLQISRTFTLPDFDRLRFNMLSLEEIVDLTDLVFLSGLDPTPTYTFSFIGLDGVTSLAPLQGLHGAKLSVGPKLAEQAQELVENGSWREYEIVYPEGGWSVDDLEFTLLSLDELETMPKSMLRHVTSVYIAGSRVCDPEVFDVSEDWSRKDARGWPALSLHNRVTGEETPLDEGVIEDLSVFADLSNLRRLELCNQPLTSLDGIQALSMLDSVSICYSGELTDASPLFTLQGLYSLNLRRTGLSSIEGVQNLTELHWLTLSDSPISDLTPLASCDFSAADEQGGIYLRLNGLDLFDGNIEALSSIPRYGLLAANDLEPEKWIPLVQDCEILVLNMDRCFRTNENLARFCAEHPELHEINLNENEGVTDLTPLLSLPNLEKLVIASDMQQALESLEGKEIAFEIETW